MSNKNTHFTFSTFFFENRAVYEIMRENIVVPDRPQVTVWRMRIAFWIPRATNTQWQYVLLIVSHYNNCLQELVSVSRFTSVVFLGEYHFLINSFLNLRPLFHECKVKVKITLVQALRLCTGHTAHRGSRGIALLYRHWGSVQAVRPIGGVEVLLYCTGTEALYRPYGP
jgi:hypothetical protein